MVAGMQLQWILTYIWHHGIMASVVKIEGSGRIGQLDGWAFGGVPATGSRAP